MPVSITPTSITTAPCMYANTQMAGRCRTTKRPRVPLPPSAHAPRHARNEVQTRPKAAAAAVAGRGGVILATYHTRTRTRTRLPWTRTSEKEKKFLSLTHSLTPSHPHSHSHSHVPQNRIKHAHARTLCRTLATLCRTRRTRTHGTVEESRAHTQSVFFEYRIHNLHYRRPGNGPNTAHTHTHTHIVSTQTEMQA